MKKFISIICLFLFSLHSKAQLMSSGPFYFEGGNVMPKSTLSIALKSLELPIEENTPIVVTCDIENPNYSKPYPVVIKLSSFMRDDNICSLDGIISSTRLYLLNKKISKYQIHTTFSYWETLNFYNYDDIDTVFISNCKVFYDSRN